MNKYTPEQVDLRNLIYADTQFGHRGETDLKLAELQALVARGWMQEGEENNEFDVTDAGRSAIATTLRQQSERVDEGMDEGIAKAAAYIQKKADDYAAENCGTEWDTGATTYHYGQAGEDYHHTLIELAEEIAALAQNKQAERTGGAGEAVLTPTEALFGFMGWLTSRDQVSGPFSANHEASEAVALIGKFMEANGLPDCRNEWANRLVHPAEDAFTPPAQQSGVAVSEHPDDVAVDLFAVAMKEKLARARAKGRSGWNDKSECSQQLLSDLLRKHVEKGDPRDVANFCMFLHQRGEAVAPLLAGGVADGRKVLLDLANSIGKNASGAGIDNDKRPSDYKAGMVKAYEHCLEMVRKRLSSRPSQPTDAQDGEVWS